MLIERVEDMGPCLDKDKSMCPKDECFWYKSDCVKKPTRKPTKAPTEFSCLNIKKKIQFEDTAQSAYG